jgi:hypothetical protein
MIKTAGNMLVVVKRAELKKKSKEEGGSVPNKKED